MLFPSEDNVGDDEARDELEDDPQECVNSSQVIPINITEEEFSKVSSLAEKSKALKDCSIAQIKARHCKTYSHALTFHNGKRETKRLCQVYPGGTSHENGKKRAMHL